MSVQGRLAMRFARLTILLVMLAGQVRAEPAGTPSGEQIAAIETGVCASLNNVNAKNSSGRYVGNFAFDGFLRNNDGWSFTILVVDDPLHMSAQRTCRDWGLF